MAAKIVEATEAFSSDALGFPRPVAKGETFPATHKIPRTHPGSFVEWECDNAETATAAPGEKRRTRRSRKAKSRKTKKTKASSGPKASSGKGEKGKSLSKADAPGGGTGKSSTK